VNSCCTHAVLLSLFCVELGWLFVRAALLCFGHGVLPGVFLDGFADLGFVVHCASIPLSTDYRPYIVIPYLEGVTVEEKAFGLTAVTIVKTNGGFYLMASVFTP
jgi:hypothetical protein